MAYIFLATQIAKIAAIMVSVYALTYAFLLVMP